MTFAGHIVTIANENLTPSNPNEGALDSIVGEFTRSFCLTALIRAAVPASLEQTGKPYMTTCAVCQRQSVKSYRNVDGVEYYECDDCGSIFADPDFLARVDAGSISNYEHAYWESEMRAAHERSYGPSLQRLAETFIFCRIPIRRFVDIGSGPGYLLDAASDALPNAANVFYGVELYPPAADFRSKHPNYITSQLGDTNLEFDAGVCIEVIEHLTPAMLNSLIAQLAKSSKPGSLYLFNSGQPTYVKHEDPSYLDPLGRGHIVSYSTSGVEKIFSAHGFRILDLPGRSWAFLAEYKSRESETASPLDILEKRLWSPLPENVALLQEGRLGSLLYCAGLDAARVYLEHARATEYANWARRLDGEVERMRTELSMLAARNPNQTISSSGSPRSLPAPIGALVRRVRQSIR